VVELVEGLLNIGHIPALFTKPLFQLMVQRPHSFLQHYNLRVSGLVGHIKFLGHPMDDLEPPILERVMEAIDKSNGDWFLFTDADTRHEPTSVSATLEHARSRNFELISLLPKCLTGSFIEDLIQPCAMAFLGLWFPIKKINDPNSKAYFANGQYLFMHRKLYEKTGGHAAVRGEYLEDFALMKKAKELGARVQLALGIHLYGTRMYDSLERIWAGWRRIYLHAFQKKAALLIVKAVDILFFSVLPFVCFAPLVIAAWGWPERNGFLLGMAIAILGIILITAWKAFEVVKARPAYALLHPFAALFVSMILLESAWIAASGRQTEWR